MALQELSKQFPIVDPNLVPSDYLLQYLRDRGGFLSEVDQKIASLLENEIIAGDGLEGGGFLGEGSVTLSANASSILDLISTDQGSVLYRDSDEWKALAPGTSGQFLKTNGTGANPEWATPSGGGGGGGSTWTTIFAGPITTGVSELDFDVTSYSDLLIIGSSVSTSSSGFRNVIVSTDGGSSFYSSSGDYITIASAGTTSSEISFGGQSASTTAARSFWVNIQGIGVTGTHKQGQSNIGDRTFVGSTDPITHIRVQTTAGTFSGGSLYVIGREAASSGGGSSGGNGEATWIKPSSSDFTQRVGTGSISDFASGVNIQAPGTSSNSNNLNYCVQSIPTPGPNGWEAIGRFRRHFPLTSWMSTGMILRDDVGGRSRLYWLGNDSVTGFNRNTYTNDTTWNSVSGISSAWNDLDFWMRIVDDLSDHIIYVSKDGINWQQIYSESRTTWMTPTQVGFFLNPNAGHSSSSNLRSTQTFSCLSWQTNPL